MQPDHFKVLKALALFTGRECCWPFEPICEATKLDRKRVRFVCRILRRQGYAEFYNALWNDDGQPAGAGYCISPAGKTLYHEMTGIRHMRVKHTQNDPATKSRSKVARSIP